jgi:hypothetical protein
MNQNSAVWHGFIVLGVTLAVAHGSIFGGAAYPVRSTKKGTAIDREG